MSPNLRQLFLDEFGVDQDRQSEPFDPIDVSHGQGSGLPHHIRSTIKAIDRIHNRHHQGASPPHRLARLVTLALGNPLVVGLVVTAIGGWVLLNLAIEIAGGRAFDPPPFQWLELLMSMCSLVVVLWFWRRNEGTTNWRN